MTRAFSAGSDLYDLAEMLGQTTMLEWVVAKSQQAASDTFTFHRDGRLLGLFGIHPVSPGLGEVWFDIKPEAAPDMVYLARQFRLTLTASRYPAFVTVVRTDAGARIARACGFRLFERQAAGDIYERSGETSGLRRQRRRRPEGNVEGAAAPVAGGTVEATG